MDLGDLKLKTLGIDAEKFGRIFSFVDYGNVNYWYEKDQRDTEGNTLKTEQKLIVDIEKLANFTGLFSEQKRFYYIASGQVFHTLKELADLYINAQVIKAEVAIIKETTPRKGRSLDIGSASGGQGS